MGGVLLDGPAKPEGHHESPKCPGQRRTQSDMTLVPLQSVSLTSYRERGSGCACRTEISGVKPLGVGRNIRGKS